MVEVHGMLILNPMTEKQDGAATMMSISTADIALRLLEQGATIYVRSVQRFLRDAGGQCWREAVTWGESTTCSHIGTNPTLCMCVRNLHPVLSLDRADDGTFEGKDDGDESTSSSSGTLRAWLDEH